MYGICEVSLQHGPPGLLRPPLSRHNVLSPGTIIRSLSCVDTLMGGKIGLLTEACLAAFIRLLCSVSTLMFGGIPTQTEGFLTPIRHTGPLSAVNGLVCDKV